MTAENISGIIALLRAVSERNKQTDIVNVRSLMSTSASLDELISSSPLSAFLLGVATVGNFPVLVATARAFYHEFTLS